jgi:hypothetical protein
LQVVKEGFGPFLTSDAVCHGGWVHVCVKVKKACEAGPVYAEFHSYFLLCIPHPAQPKKQKENMLNMFYYQDQD